MCVLLTGIDKSVTIHNHQMKGNGRINKSVILESSKLNVLKYIYICIYILFTCLKRHSRRQSVNKNRNCGYTNWFLFFIANVGGTVHCYILLYFLCAVGLCMRAFSSSICFAHT